MIGFQCTCGNKLEVSDKYAGKVGKCPACGKTMQIPSSQSDAPRAATRDRILFECSCGRHLRAAAEHAGKNVRCPKCGQRTTVPVELAVAGVADPPERDAGPKSASPVPNVTAAGKRVPGLAIAGLCVGIAAIIVCWVPVLGLLVGLVGVGLGGYSFLRFRLDASVGKGIPIAGLSISSVATVLGLVFTVVFLAAQFGTSNGGGGHRSEVPVRRVNVGWRDGTSELQRITAELGPAERLVLGLAALAGGQDIYAARVTIANTGNLPVSISPQNIRIHLGQESTGVTTWDRSEYLQACVLQPGHYVTGLVNYMVSIPAGAAIRTGRGTLSYNDSSIQVTYNQ